MIERSHLDLWCEVKHRVIDWVSRSPSLGSSKFEVVIMIERVIEEMHGSD
jgi:hypothetical protein